MKQKFYRGAGVALLLTVFVGCGQKQGEDSDRTGIGNGSGNGDQGALRPVVIESEVERPTCGASTKGMLIFIRESAQFQICLGLAWETVEQNGAPGATGAKGQSGEKGDPGVAGSALGFNVRNKGGQTIGTTDFHAYADFLYNSEIFFLLTDGVVMRVSVTTGRNSGQFCYYAAADCSGACLYPSKVGEKNKVVEGLSGLFKVIGTEVSAAQTYQSYAGADNPAPTCTALGAPVMATMISVDAAYNPPGAVSYPFSAPLSVEPQ